MTNVDYCKGCATYKVKNSSDKLIPCSYLPDNIDGNCPCTECIIKVMCEHMCDRYISFAKHIDGGSIC